jgi:formate dehydrogenase major subunit
VSTLDVPVRLCKGQPTATVVAAISAPGEPLLTRAGCEGSIRVKCVHVQWPVIRQATGPDRLGRGAAVRSPKSTLDRPRTATADRVVDSVCPYCAVGCGQKVFVKDDRVVQIEGDPASPISRGRLCPKGSASLQLTTGSAREYRVRYRRPRGLDWEDLDLDTAMDLIADRVIASRRAYWQEEVDGKRVNRTMGIASLGGATLDNEENYLMKKLYTAMGAIQIENQARI